MTYDQHTQVSLAVLQFRDEGRQAAKDGKSLEDNPYTDGDGFAKAYNGISVHAESYWERGFKSVTAGA